MTARIGVKKQARSRAKPVQKKAAKKRAAKELVTYQLDVHIATGEYGEKEIVETLIGKNIWSDEEVETITFYGDGGVLVVPTHRLIFARRFEYITEEHKEAADVDRNDRRRVF